MHHDEFEEALYALFDGELGPEDRRRVESHLAGCPGCRRAHARWDQISKALFKLPPPRASENFVERFMQRLDEPAEVFRFPLPLPRPRWLVPAIGFAAAVLFLSVYKNEAAVSTEDLLLANGKAGVASEWTLLAKASDKDEVLNFVLEEP
ncbi:MAG: hypothetical protein A3G41_04015 [Elusimicrobia bacterium RIFCSPLOWO2_12_FULL_59_9]|nr:MAG: hypothetical protein A3G41_04015 [Elusimicrobia bacterium RIFCSPLOWO2_12_FULL_59_9]